jgi:hypothetical protein
MHATVVVVEPVRIRPFGIFWRSLQLGTRNIGHIAFQAGIVPERLPWNRVVVASHNDATSRREIIVKFRFLEGLRQRGRLKSRRGKSRPAEFRKL